MRPLFLPTARQTNWLLVIGFLSIGYALYLRYLAIEQSSVGLACDGGLNTWLCLSRKVATFLFNNTVFGTVAVIAAGLNLLRPSLVLFALVLIAGGTGIVLYNVATSAFAIALLILSLARPAPATE
jgi:hypothetical protein